MNANQRTLNAGLLLVTGLFATASADTITVCLDGSCDFTDPAAASAVAVTGDVIEIGAGMAVPTVRMEAQHAADQWNAPLIRLNLETPKVEHLKQPGVSIAMGALEALVKIDEAMKRQPAS